ncbi:dihydroorotate dehydrogenase (quinone), mitochondrial isoform X1 [Lepeophtheirus salmonis]|uniref:dihydroorotate dehydrogenase (quinone), mitochondrial isoform X1 n=2 Tax=Lepeophtheirus salmonis TaxID=72036 RepID=UPI003AF391A9
MKKTGIVKMKSYLGMGCLGGIAFSVIAYSRNDEKLFSEIIMPTTHRMFSGETAHNLGVWAIKKRIFFKNKFPEEDTALLQSTLFGLHFKNPVGIAAGFDKNAEALEGYSDLGFGSVEVGSVTPKPQPGNPKPRVFRLTEDKAIINRYGFNNDGHDAMWERIKKFRVDTSNNHENNKFVLGINLGKNKTSEDAVADYVEGVKKFASLSDYLVINVSSPNTPGLRALQGKSSLEALISAILKARNEIQSKTPILLKIAPDLTPEDMNDIAEVILSEKCRVDGLIISNTTISRPSSLKSSNKSETGGLSGAPLMKLSTNVIRKMYILTKGQIPIIGVGGISTGQDAFEKIEAGASLVQIYSAIVYQGPPIVKKINRELADILREKNIKSISEVIGKKASID